MAKVLVALVKGFEDLEAIAVYDLLKRGNIEVTLAAVEQAGHKVIGSHGIEISADSLLQNEQADAYDALYLPGGPGVAQLRASADIERIVKAFVSQDKLVAALCAAPSVLIKHGLIETGRITHYPGALNGLTIPPGVAISGNAVEQHGQFLTGRGPGEALEFGLALVDTLLGRSAREEVASALYA